MNRDVAESLINRYVILKSVPLAVADPFSVSARGSSHAERRVSIEVDEMSFDEVVRRSSDRSTLAMAPVLPMRLVQPADGTDSDSGVSTWGVEAVGGLTTPYSGQGVRVAVLDTGIDASHPAFSGKTIVQRNFTGEADGDLDGHGTHCAGTIAGRLENRRIAVAPGVQHLIIGKVLSTDGGSTQSVASAIGWALDEGANVISMSLSLDFVGYKQRLVEQAGLPDEAATSFALQGYRANVRLFDDLAALVRSGQSFRGDGCLMLGASGNESRRKGNPAFTLSAAPPAAADGILSVGAVGKVSSDDQSPDPVLGIAEFSNAGANVVGPGVDVVSAWRGGGVKSISGTSMATPHVAGVAALLAQKQTMETGRIDALSLQSQLLGTAKRLSGITFADGGSGLAWAPQN